MNEKKIKLFKIRIGKFNNYKTIVNYRENCLKKPSLWKEAAWKSYCYLKILQKKNGNSADKNSHEQQAQKNFFKYICLKKLITSSNEQRTSSFELVFLNF